MRPFTHRAETPALSQKPLRTWNLIYGTRTKEKALEKAVRPQKLFQSREQLFPAGLCLHVL